MTEKEFSALLQKYLQGKATPKEVQLIEKWYLRITTKHDMQLDLPSEQLRDAHWNNIESKMRRGRAVSFWPRVGVAASVLFALLIGAYLLMEPFSRSISFTSDQSSGLPEAAFNYKNTSHQNQVYELPDGSRVSLQPGSSLQTDDSFNEEKREVRLVGEAFFEVKHDPSRPFYVIADELVTKVVGTSFTIRAIPGSDVTVAVKTGKVTVFEKDISNTNAEKTAIVLTPNQQIIYKVETGTINKMLVNKPALIVAEEQVAKLYRFENASVIEVFNSLQLLYGVTIEAEPVTFANCILTTSGDTHDLFESIDIICEAIGATYHVEGSRILITGDGCK